MPCEFRPAISQFFYITWSWRNVPNVKFSVLVFSRLMSCSMSILKNCAKWKYFNSNALRCIEDQRFAFKNCCILFLALILNLSNLSSCSRQRYTTSHTQFSSRDQYEPTAQWLNTGRALKLSFFLPLCHYAWHWASQGSEMSAFILLCSLTIFFFHEFCQ